MPHEASVDVAAPVVACASPGEVEVLQPGVGETHAIRAFKFDLVCHGGFCQRDFFAHCGATPLIESALSGLKVTLFAYGATGSGKTHTMVGARPIPGAAPEAAGGEVTAEGEGKGADDDQAEGLIPRSASYLYESIAAQVAAAGGGGGTTVFASYYEVR